MKAYIILTGFVLALFLVSSFTAHAQQKGKVTPPPAAPASAASEDGKVDISDLENKYWAPKDTDFSVVQNRTYTKAKRFSFSLMASQLLRDGYSEGFGYAMNLNYYFSERSGVEVQYQALETKNNGALEGYTTQFGGALPAHGKISSMYDVGYSYVPFYAKMSVLGKRIIYFDMAITPKFGMVSYDQQLRNGNSSESSVMYGFDINQMFFLSKHWTIRADLKNRWFSEKRKNWNSGVAESDAFINPTVFSIGVQYFF
jgi:outer membrane beta-barrel protein